MTIIKSIAFCTGWIITASIGLWAMVLYGAFFAIREIRTLEKISEVKHGI